MITIRTNPNWREAARRAIRSYPALLQAEADLHTQKITPSYSQAPASGGASRSTECIATMTLPPKQQRDLDAVRQAIDTTRRYRNADLRLNLISLIFWQNKFTLIGAALEIHISEATAEKWVREFVELVDAYRRKV